MKIGIECGNSGNLVLLQNAWYLRRDINIIQNAVYVFAEKKLSQAHSNIYTDFYIGHLAVDIIYLHTIVLCIQTHTVVSVWSKIDTSKISI